MKQGASIRAVAVLRTNSPAFLDCVFEAYQRGETVLPLRSRDFLVQVKGVAVSAGVLKSIKVKK